MIITRSLDEAAEHFKEAVIAVGNFDGMHLGHRAIIEKAIERADILKCPCLIVTFEPHPQHVIGKQPMLAILTPTEDKLNLLSTYAIDAVLLMHFTTEFARLEPEMFVKEVYVQTLNIQEIIVGYSHNFGRYGSGDGQTLTTLASEYGFKVHIIPPLIEGEVKVNSSKIRSLLTEGAIKQSKQLLGYSYYLSGKVVAGEGRGKEIEFPTANIELNARHRLIPKRGVYAVQVNLNGDIYDGVMNIGVRPTFEETRELYEVHILDFKGDIYKQKITVNFIERIRSEKRFSSVLELKNQIANDVSITRNILSSYSLKE